MELDELKDLWSDLSDKIEKQEKLTNQMIEKMTQQEYRSQINKVALPELAGGVVCLMAAALMIWNFQTIDSALMQIFAVIAIGILIITPILSLHAVNGLRKVKISSITYLEAINNYRLKKISFQRLQKINLALSLFFLLIAVPVLLDMTGKNINEQPQFWTLIFPSGVTCLLIFAFWVMRKYNKALKQAERAVSELND